MIPAPPDTPDTLRPFIRPLKPRGERVVVVDDDRDIREILAETLAEENYDVSTAVNGLDALDKILRAPQLPHLVVLDLGLPYLNGPGVKAAIDSEMDLRCEPPLPFVIITAGSGASARMHTEHVFPKPLDVDAFLATVRLRIARYLATPRRPF